MKHLLFFIIINSFLVSNAQLDNGVYYYSNSSYLLEMNAENDGWELNDAVLYDIESGEVEKGQGSYHKINMSGVDDSYDGPEGWYEFQADFCSYEVELIGTRKVKLILHDCKETPSSNSLILSKTSAEDVDLMKRMIERSDDSNSSMNKESTSEVIIDFPDKEATFPCHTFFNYDSLGVFLNSVEVCGVIGLRRFIRENVKYPEEAMEMGEQGKVYINFIVNQNGKISNAKVVKGVSKELDNEALRVINAMPAWEPGEIKDQAVKTKVSIPISFHLY